MLTDAQLQTIMPNVPQAKRQLYAPALNQAMAAHGVNTLLRTAAFVAQLAHESGELRWMEEIWGPTAAQLRYEPSSDLAARLGNTQPGDGKRFKGRGPIQITGRFNYDKYGGLLSVDLASDPALAATPDVAFATADLFWKSNGLNELADAEDFVAITRRINGGTNGLAQRQSYYEKAKAVLAATGFVADAEAPAAAALRGAKALPARAHPAWAGLEPLTRGAEAMAHGRKPAAAKPAAKKAGPKKAAAKPATGRMR